MPGSAIDSCGESVRHSLINHHCSGAASQATPQGRRRVDATVRSELAADGVQFYVFVS